MVDPKDIALAKNVDWNSAQRDTTAWDNEYMAATNATLKHGTVLTANIAWDFGDPNGMNFERKFTDPEGILFDISEKGWYGALAEAAAKAKEPETV